jgi:nucleotide-binding universal stress UspA family protein
VTKPRPVQVVVAYDLSPSAEEALLRAIDVAARAPSHVLHIVSALDPHAPGPAGEAQGSTYEGADRLRKLIVERVTFALAGRPTAAEVEFYVHARIGRPADEILALSSEVGADLIFIGSHGKVGVERLLLGSVSERIVREAGCPVMVVRPKSYADVDLLKVFEYEHERKPHREPHRYSYTNNQVITRPRDWPIS